MSPDLTIPYPDSFLRGLLNGEQFVETLFQPVVDLRRGQIAGYEALTRFPGDKGNGPGYWFETAKQFACAEALDLLAVESAASRRADLPPNTFLSINVDPLLLLSDTWGRWMEKNPDFRKLIIEVTEQQPIEDYARARQVIATIRRGGGFFAVDDAGSGHASLRHVLALRPDLVKLDRVFIEQCNLETAKSATIEMMGAFANRLDAWIIAEGVETEGELRELIRLGTPLGQGFLFGKASSSWARVPAELAEKIATLATGCLDDEKVGCAAEPIPQVYSVQKAFEKMAGERLLQAVAVVDEANRPVCLVYRQGSSQAVQFVQTPMIANKDSPLESILQRAITREERSLFAPIAITNDEGKFEGFLSLERLIRAMLLPGRTQTAGSGAAFRGLKARTVQQA